MVGIKKPAPNTKAPAGAGRLDGGRLAAGASRDEALLAGGVSIDHPAVKNDVGRGAAVAARQGAAAAPAAADAPGAIDVALNAGNTAVGMATMASMPLMLGGGLIGAPVRDAAEVAKLGFFGRAKNRLAKVFSFVTEPTFESVGNKLGVNEAVSGVVQPVADGVGNFAENNFKGVSNKLADRSRFKADGHHGVMKAQSSRLMATEIHPELATHVREMHNVVHAPRFDAANFDKAQKAFAETANTLSEAGHAKAIKSTVKDVEKLAGRAEKLAASSGMAHSLENIGQTIKNAPSALGKTTVLNGVVNGAFIGGSVLSMASDARSFQKDLQSLKRMYAKMTHTDVSKVSTMQVLAGNVPVPVRAARAHMLKVTTISEVADAIGLAVNIKGMMGKGFGMIAGFVAYSLPQMISDKTKELMGPNVLNVYDAISKAQDSGQQISAGDYAQLLYLASPDLKAKGLENPFLQKLAEEFAQKQTRAEDILVATTNGEITSRISHMIVEAETTQKAAVEKTVEAATPTISHVERLQSGPRQHHHRAGKGDEKVPHGHFSNKVVNEAAMDAAPVPGR